jgi:Gpi18-like mannosyltransferase
MPERKTPTTPALAEAFILLTGIVLALLLRVLLRDAVTVDFTAFYGPWMEFIRQKGGFPALGEQFANYAPLYLYLLTLAVALLPFLPDLYSVKLISTVFDLGTAFFGSRLVRLRHPRGPAALFAFLVILFAPTVVINSAYWGQTDSIYTAGLVACVYFLAVRKESYAFIAFGLALAMKMQALFLLPLLGILLLCRYVSWKSFLIPPAIFLLSLIPAWLAGRPFGDLLLTYAQQAGYYQALAANVPNLYQWLPNEQYELIYPVGVVWTAAIVFLLAMAVVIKRPVITPALIVSLATLSTLIVPYFLPKMHDRYFYPADVFSILFAFYFPAYFYIPILVGGVSLFSYFPFLFHYEVIPLKYLALVQLITIVILIRHLAGWAFQVKAAVLQRTKGSLTHPEQ